MANAKYKIKGNNKIPNFDSDIEVDVDDKYEAYSKTIPQEQTPIPGGGGYITWFNAYGVREKGASHNADVPYSVTLSALPAGKTLFALYGGQPHRVPTNPHSPGKIIFTLSIGDPPLGSGP